MRPKSILVVLVESMSELMDNDIITKRCRKSHKLDIETDVIAMTTAPPPRFLMATWDAPISKSELKCEFHCPMRKVGFCQHFEFQKLFSCQRLKVGMWFFLLFYPGVMWSDKCLYFSVWNPLWRTHNYLSIRFDAETHTAESWDTNESKIFHPITACKRNWKTVQWHTELRDEIDHRAKASYQSTYQNSHNYDSSQPERQEIQ